MSPPWRSAWHVQIPDGAVTAKLKIGLFSHYFLPEIGAPSARLGDFASNWAASGHDVHVVTCFPNHPSGVVYPGYRSSAYLLEVERGVRIHRNWSYVTPNKGVLKKTLGHLSYWLSARRNSLHHLPNLDCAIGSSPTFFAAMAARDCARRQGIPFVMEVRDLWPAIFRDLGVVRNRLVLNLLERWEMSLYKDASKIITVTESFRENLVARGVPEKKVATITNGADIDYWDPAKAHPEELRTRLGLGGKFVVLYIGAHGISQALGVYLRVAGKLASDERIQFVFVGDGAEKDGLTREAASLGLKNVRFLPPVGSSEVRDHYAMADLCLVPLRSIPLFESFIPSKMFEIMSMGRPIMGSLGGEAARILERSGGARVVAAEDDGAIAASIGELIQSSDVLGQMGEAGRWFVAEEYSRRRLSEKYLQILGELRASSGAMRRTN
jgi:glycosyltransferase involved in cell wall biosynthesis